MRAYVYVHVHVRYRSNFPSNILQLVALLFLKIVYYLLSLIKEVKTLRKTL